MKNLNNNGIIMVTIWVKLKNYINSLPPDTVFKRRRMFMEVYHEDICHIKVKRENCLDWYRLYIEKLGYIKKFSHGHYQKIKQIPPGLTLPLAKHILSDQSWKTWFIQSLDERIQSEIENYERRTGKTIS